jgi:hypothetical protein
MIYLICQPSFKNDHISLKIGYASSLEARYKQYEACTPSFKKISSRFGDRDEEPLIHRYFHGLSDINFIKSEWYEIHKDKLDWFIEEFKKDYSEMEKAILDDFTNISVPLYKYFSKKYPTDPRVVEFDKKSMGLNRKINLLYRKLIQNFPELSENIIKFLKQMGDIPLSSDRLKLLCETRFNSDVQTIMVLKLISNDESVYYPYISLGPDRCKELNYNMEKIGWEINHGWGSVKIDTILDEIYKEFHVGDIISNTDIKQKLRDIYLRIGYSRTPKAVNLKEFFEIKKCHLTDKSTGSRDHGYKLLRRLL